MRTRRRRRRGRGAQYLRSILLAANSERQSFVRCTVLESNRCLHTANSTVACAEVVCEEGCRNTHDGPACYCRAGYEPRAGRCRGELRHLRKSRPPEDVLGFDNDADPVAISLRIRI
ncbi:hypothetical protein EVAR_93764_1 [Eumeta japonica]|uniref:EGF-like domain-containing protein n=1 Tax=Eumeta variegata TaxID=151549 RepID=A0A4C1VBS1_EUMVA|nr:hypothetical protein EVAR_93764_1 [Eumeta japonica]